ncbi:MAG: MFS transporter [Luteitalea sp.]|nr:MFS transporter [Luteitalea sp.]
MSCAEVNNIGSNPTQGLGRSAKAWQIRIFAVTWIAYAGFYLCRKNFSVAMPLLGGESGLTKLDFANLIFGYSLMYAAGQPLFGVLADRFGARRVVATGMLLAVVANIFMVTGTSVLMLAPLMLMNGIGQATGWPGLVQIMANWFRRGERGMVMAWWTTNYVLGGFLATVFATWVATSSLLLPGQGWQRAFWVPAVLLAVIAALFVAGARDRPEDSVVRSEEAAPDAATRLRSASARLRYASATQADAPAERPHLGRALASPLIWIIALGCLFAKITRYAFLFWLPLYMTEQLGYTVDQAGYMASIFELSGFGGAILAGYVSDRLFQSRRFPVTALMFFMLAVVCLVHPLTAGYGYVASGIGIALIGIANYGPDTLLQGAAAQDAGAGLGTGTVSGLISGVGSVGQLFSPYLVAFVAARYGWNGLFQVFTVVAFVGGALQAILWNYGRRAGEDHAGRTPSIFDRRRFRRARVVPRPER